jgi:MEMO1 family protein
MKLKLLLILPLMLSFFNFKSQSQGPADEPGLIHRQPAVAGQFYSGNAAELRNDLTALFSEAPNSNISNIIALLSPHAGYVFSGKTAAAAFNQLDAVKEYDNIFVLTSSHRTSFDGASIYYIGHYNMPMGQVKVNRQLAKELVDRHACFTFRREAHLQEHSLEVQLPFLQYKLKKDFQIVPIVIGTNSMGTINEVAEALRPYFHSRNLFVISTDLSHYPSYTDANMVDSLTIDAVLSNNSQALINTLAGNSEKAIHGLQTSMCGWSAVLALLKLTENNPLIRTNLIGYVNSGDSPHGDNNRVVGYAAMAFSTGESVIEPQTPISQTDGFSLPDAEKRALLQLARQSLVNYVKNGQIESLSQDMFTVSLGESYGVFVSLYLPNKQLRGCIGRFFTNDPVYQTVQQMTIASAVNDTRFRPVAAQELEQINIEISVLSPMKRIHSLEEIELGKHGIYIVKGQRSGTFLPQVATETGWTVEEFVGRCSRDKAGLGWDGWRTAEMYVYTALVFCEEEFN